MSDVVRLEDVHYLGLKGKVAIGCSITDGEVKPGIFLGGYKDLQGSQKKYKYLVHCRCPECINLPTVPCNEGGCIYTARSFEMHAGLHGNSDWRSTFKLLDSVGGPPVRSAGRPVPIKKWLRDQSDEMKAQCPVGSVLRLQDHLRGGRWEEVTVVRIEDNPATPKGLNESHHIVRLSNGREHEVLLAVEEIDPARPANQVAAAQGAAAQAAAVQGAAGGSGGARNVQTPQPQPRVAASAHDPAAAAAAAAPQSGAARPAALVPARRPRESDEAGPSAQRARRDDNAITEALKPVRELLESAEDEKEQLRAVLSSERAAKEAAEARARRYRTERESKRVAKQTAEAKAAEDRAALVSTCAAKEAAEVAERTAWVQAAYDRTKMMSAIAAKQTVDAQAAQDRAALGRERAAREAAEAEVARVRPASTAAQNAEQGTCAKIQTCVDGLNAIMQTMSQSMASRGPPTAPAAPPQS